VEVPVSARDAANPTDPSANPNGSREQVLAPIYGDGEKHPLPPVFPLDGSVPVAGFSDSGGDSFALLERLYRGELGATPIAVEPPAAQIELAEAPPPHEPGAPAGAVAGVQPQGADLVAVPVDVDAGTDWRLWAAAGAAVIGSAAAYALYARTRSAREQSDRAVPPRARLKPLERTP
jgi:hypothetical protein